MSKSLFETHGENASNVLQDRIKSQIGNVANKPYTATSLGNRYAVTYKGKTIIVPLFAAREVFIALDAFLLDY